MTVVYIANKLRTKQACFNTSAFQGELNMWRKPFYFCIEYTQWKPENRNYRKQNYNSIFPLQNLQLNLTMDLTGICIHVFIRRFISSSCRGFN